MSKYQYDLDNAIQSSMRNIIQSAELNDEKEYYTAVVDNDNLIDSLNRLQLTISGDLPTIKRIPTTVSKFLIYPSSYDELSIHFGLSQRSV